MPCHNSLNFLISIYWIAVHLEPNWPEVTIVLSVTHFQDFGFKCVESSRVHMKNIALPAVLLFVHMCSCQAETGGSCRGALKAGRWQRQGIREVISSRKKNDQFDTGQTWVWILILSLINYVHLGKSFNLSFPFSAVWWWWHLVSSTVLLQRKWHETLKQPVHVGA